MWRRIAYRVRQFVRALTARASEEEIDRAIHILEPEAQALFRRQPRQDQCHALRVCHALRQAGYSDPQLFAAALLHDVGKAAARLTPWQRSVVVVLDRLAPGALRRIGSGTLAELDESHPGERSSSIARYLRHSELGARWAQEAGCSALTVALIRRHQEPVREAETQEDRLLAALEAADGRN